jgi:hypothetical protein
LQGALLSLYGNYEKSYRNWEQNAEARARGITPPVFIVVCNNTNVSKMVFDFIGGWEKIIAEKAVVQAGQLPIFRNDDGAGGWLHRPNTILVDSQQLESGGAMSDDFKKIANREIEEFKADYRNRFPGRDADDLKDEDLLREVMNTVGKAGKLGEHVRCVVSVSMLTEGWDANTVTHVLGVRAFGTQLLCEQVVGRALRRMSYAPIEHGPDKGRFSPEYAEVYGVPFSFIPCSGATKDPKPGPMPTRVRAIESRIDCEITFPLLMGYRYDIAGERLTAAFTEESKLPLSTADVPTKTENAPIVGESSIHTLDDLKRHRINEVALASGIFCLAVLYVAFAGAHLPVGAELDAVGRVKVDGLDLALESFLLCQRSHHQQRVAKNHAIRPVLLVVVEVHLLVKSLWPAIEVCEQVGLVLRLLLQSGQSVDDGLRVNLLLDVDGHYRHSQVFPVLLVFSLPHQLRVKRRIARVEHGLGGEFLFGHEVAQLLGGDVGALVLVADGFNLLGSNSFFGSYDLLSHAPFPFPIPFATVSGNHE